MLIRLLASISDRLISSLEGLVRLLSALLPVLWRFLFVASPLLLASLVTFFMAGRTATAIASAAIIVLLLLGYTWSRRAVISGPRVLSWRVITAVVALDMLLVFGSFFAKQQAQRNKVTLSFEETPEPESSRLIEKTEASAKAKVFAEAVGRALDVENKFDDERRFDIPLLKRALSELRSMGELKVMPDTYVESTLEYCRYRVNNPRSDINGQCAQGAPLVIKAAVDARMKSVCSVLYEIQTDAGSLEAESRAATVKLCGE